MTRRFVLSIVCGLGMAAAVAGVATAAPARIAIGLFRFQPATVEIVPGEEVTWDNGDDIQHTVTSGTPGHPDGRFTLRLDGKGATARHTFTERGVYPYFCERHQQMRGEIRVH